MLYGSSDQRSSRPKDNDDPSSASTSCKLNSDELEVVSTYYIDDMSRHSGFGIGKLLHTLYNGSISLVSRGGGGLVMGSFFIVTAL